MALFKVFQAMQTAEGLLNPDTIYDSTNFTTPFYNGLIAAGAATTSFDVDDASVIEQVNQVSVVKNKVYVKDYENLKVGEDYAPAINAAAIACGNMGGGVVILPNGIVQYGQDLNIPTGVSLEGTVSSSITSSNGTQLKRIAAVSIKLIGTTILTGTPTRYNEFRKIRFNGNGFSTVDLFVIKAAGVVIFEDCFLSNTNARLLYAQELMDARFNDCWFEQGGTTDGVTPSMELLSGSGYEYTNQVMFRGCRWEHYNGTALKTSGANTNEITFTDCKFESLNSNQPHVSIKDANMIHFNGVQICSKGTVGNTISSQVVIDNSKGIKGALFLEHTGTIDTTAAKIDKFVDIKNGSSSIDLYVHLYGNGLNTLASNPVMVAGGSPRTTSIRGSIKDSAKSVSNMDYAIPYGLLIHGDAPKQRIQYNPITNEYWDFRAVAANGITEYQLVHGSGGSEVIVWKTASSNDPVLPTLKTASDNATAAGAGVPVNGLYKDSSGNVKIRTV